LSQISEQTLTESIALLSASIVIGKDLDGAKGLEYILQCLLQIILIFVIAEAGKGMENDEYIPFNYFWDTCSK